MMLVKWFLFFDIIILLIFNFPCFAELDKETSPSGPLTEITEESILFQEIPSVFSASKYEQKISEAPSAVSIVTAEEIKKFGYRTLADILRSVRGFHITSDLVEEFAGIRGFGRPGDYNTRILLLVDGHRINDNLYDQAVIGYDLQVDIDLIKRVEVIRGPSSSIYGANAFFGVINVITKRGRDLKGPEISGEIGSNEAYKGRLSYGDKFENGLEIIVSGSTYNDQGQERYFKEFDDPATNNGIAYKLDDNQISKFFSTLAYHNLTLQGTYIDQDYGTPTAPWGAIFNDPRLRETYTRSYLDIRYDYGFDAGGDIMARIYYDRYDYEGEWPYDYPPVTIFKDDQIGEWWGGELQFTKTAMERHTIVLGGEYRMNTRQEMVAYDISPYFQYLDEKRESNNWGVFIQDEIQVSEKLIFNAGVRYDYYETFGGTANPRLALIYNPVEKTTLKLLYGQAFRPPNAYELYYHDGNITTKANPMLEPETIDTYELVWEQRFGNHLRGIVNGFYYKIEDLISQQTDPVDGLLVFNNVEEVESKGVGLELEGKWSDGIEGRISYTYQNAENKTSGGNLSNSPQHLAKFNLIVPILKEKIFLSPEVLYTGERKSLTDQVVDAFITTNLTLFSQNLLKGLEASISVYNLFDEKYGDPGAGEHVQDILEQDGRSFRIKLTYSF